MAFRLFLLGALLATIALAPTAAACTVKPLGYEVDVGPAAVGAHGSCPPAYPGGAYVRVLDTTIEVPLPL